MSALEVIYIGIAFLVLFTLRRMGVAWTDPAMWLLVVFWPIPLLYILYFHDH
jgi:hypothetical protein